MNRAPKIIRGKEVTMDQEQGVSAQTVTPSLSGATGILFMRFTTEDGASIPPHYHTSDTVAYCVRGRAVFRYGQGLEQALEMESGDYIFMPKGEVHTEETLGGDTAEFLLVRDEGGGTTIYLDDSP